MAFTSQEDAAEERGFTAHQARAKPGISRAMQAIASGPMLRPLERAEELKGKRPMSRDPHSGAIIAGTVQPQEFTVLKPWSYMETPRLRVDVGGPDDEVKIGARVTLDNPDNIRSGLALGAIEPLGAAEVKADAEAKAELEVEATLAAALETQAVAESMLAKGKADEEAARARLEAAEEEPVDKPAAVPVEISAEELPQPSASVMGEEIMPGPPKSKQPARPSRRKKTTKRRGAR